VGLAGPSGAGKTVFSEKISNFMPGCAVISMDNYNDASRLVDGNFDGEAEFESLRTSLAFFSDGPCAECVERVRALRHALHAFSGDFEGVISTSTSNQEGRVQKEVSIHLVDCPNCFGPLCKVQVLVQHLRMRCGQGWCLSQ
jgi:hypothetical protein